MKRFFVLLLSVVLSTGMLSLTAFAEEEPIAETGIVLEAEEPAEAVTEEPEAEVPAEITEAQEVLAEAEESQPEEAVAEPEEPVAEPETIVEPAAEAEAEEIAEAAAEPEVVAEAEAIEEPAPEPAAEPESEPVAEPEKEPEPAEEPEEIVVPEEEVVLEKAEAKDISSSATVTLKYSSLVYTGNARTQSKTTVVKVGSKTLKKDTDYTITYKNNVNVGTATMTIKGKGNYTGSVKKTFKITAKQLTSAKLKNRAMPYTGKPRKNTVTVYGMYKGKKTVLEEDKDYKLTYENNTKVGLATVKVKGIGNYKGTITKTFTIKPETIIFKRTWVKADGGYKGKITASGGASWTVSVSVTKVSSKDNLSCGEIGVCNGMYYYYAHGRVYAVNIATGKQVWKTGKIHMFSISSAFSDDGTLYAVGRDNGYAAYVKPDGTADSKEIWYYPFGDPENEDDAYLEFSNYGNVQAVPGKKQFTVKADMEYYGSPADGRATLTVDGKTLTILSVDHPWL